LGVASAWSAAGSAGFAVRAFDDLPVVDPAGDFARTLGRCCPVDFVVPVDDDALDVVGPFPPAEPVVSADAVAGIAASAAPTPNVMADALSHVNRRASGFAMPSPPNSTGSARNQNGRRRSGRPSLIVDMAVEIISAPGSLVRLLQCRPTRRNRHNEQLWQPNIALAHKSRI
jgi:hypothetical protein